MLAPHELKNREFSKSLRGYSTVEVDEHIDFMIEKYTELYRENDELEKRLRLTEAQLDAMKGEEESIRSALVNAQKASTRIINEANERADVIMRSAKNSCDRLIAEFKATIKKEAERLRETQREVAAFKAALFEGYQSHIELIEKIAPDVKITDVSENQAEELSAIVIERIKQNLSGKSTVISGSEVPYAGGEEDAVQESLAEEEVEVNVPAELKIPDSLFEEAESVSPSDVRDASEFPDEENRDFNEITIERTKLSDDDSAGIIDSIKKLNSMVQDSSMDDEEEFLRMLKNVSNSDSDMSSTDEFEIVYDGKKRK